MRVLALCNQKGGCGKTTTAIHLGGALAAQGERVLLVDLDPQGHATLGLGQEVGPRGGIADVLLGERAASECLLEAPGGIALLPGDRRLAEFEETSARELQPERALRRVLATLASDFDYALVDCPARADGVLPANALAAASVAVLVVETGAFALQGAVRALALLEEVARAQGSCFDVRVLSTLFDRRTRFARELLIALQARFGPWMFATAIRSHVRLREAAACGLPVQVLDPRSRAAADFEHLACEVRGLDLVDGRELEPDLELPPTPPPAASQEHFNSAKSTPQ